MKPSDSLRSLAYLEPAGSLILIFFQIPATSGSSILNFFSTARNQWFFDSDLFFPMPATSGYYNNQIQAPTLQHTREREQARTRMGWWV